MKRVKNINTMNKVLIILTSISGIVLFLIAVFPEIRTQLVGKIYTKLRVDEPKITFENFGIHKKSEPFSGCDPGYYVSTLDYDLKDYLGQTEQSFIYSAPLHDLTFTARDENTAALAPVTIDNVILEFRGFLKYPLSFFYASGECGAGASDKIFYVDRDTISTLIGDNKYKEVEMKIAPNNTETFDHIELTAQNPQDYFRVLIPMPTDGILKLALKFQTKYKGKSYYFTSKEFFIGNNQEGKSYWDKESKDWYDKGGFKNLKIY